MPSEDAAPSEPTVATFGCGAMTCNVAEHACCPVGGSHGCFLLVDGCPAGDPVDGGTTPAPPTSGLACTTYRNCGPGNQCCFDAAAGAAACLMAGACPGGQERLCTPGADTCKKHEECRMLSTSPLPNVGHCVRTGPPKP